MSGSEFSGEQTLQDETGTLNNRFGMVLSPFFSQIAGGAVVASAASSVARKPSSGSFLGKRSYKSLGAAAVALSSLGNTLSQQATALPSKDALKHFLLAIYRSGRTGVTVRVSYVSDFD